MATFRCPDCAQDVSDQAFACPRCGRPFAPTAAKKTSSSGVVILVVVLVLIVPVLGIMATLGIYGVRKYIANAKTAEAKNSLSFIARRAAAAHAEKGHLCASASVPVPANRSFVSGRKYQSAPGEWHADAASDAGFACLGFEMTMPQYFQYEYQATPTGFVARAHGDLNGDGVFSTYELSGKVVNGRLLVAPSIEETDPFE